MLDNFSVVFISMLFLSTGNALIAVLADKQNHKTYFKVFNVSFLVYILYAMICSIYMQINNFHYLFASDTITAYVPYAQDFMQMDSLKEMWDNIYNNNISKYQHTGVITIYFAIIGKLASMFDNELYFNLQLSMIFLSSFVSLFICKLLKEQGIKSALKYTFVYSFLSIHFYYSILILRDIPITLFYVISFCYMTHPNKTKSLIIISLCILGAYLIRVQSALFLLLFIFVLFIDKKIRARTIFFMLLATIFLAYVYVKLDVADTINETLEHSDMLLQTKAGDSTLNKFNSLPPVISHIVKIIYIHISPIPCWSFMSISSIATPVVNNLGVARAIAVLFNYVILGFVVYGILNFKKLKFDNKLLFALVFALLYMGLQTDSTEQRRIMACYPMLLLFACRVNDSIPQGKSKSIKKLMIAFFILMQFIGLTKYM